MDIVVQEVAEKFDNLPLRAAGVLNKSTESCSIADIKYPPFIFK